MEQSVRPISSLAGTVEVPGDKSISHRAIMIGSIAKGITQVDGFLNGEDCLSTITVFRQLGIEIDRIGENSYSINGKGLYNLIEPKDILYVGNSGTTIRLLSGILAGQNFHSILTGDASIIQRPMKRIIEPLNLMGAKINGRDNGNYAPIAIKGTQLKGITYNSPIASAQVKSSLLFAGLYANNQTTIIEPYKSRDHSEKMLEQFGAKLDIEDNKVTIYPNTELTAQNIKVPGDFSSAAFLIAAALIVPNSCLRINNVGINPTRIGFLEALQLMNGKIMLENMRYFGKEPVADIIVETSELKGITISGEWIPKLIDELPLLAVIATQAEGETKVSDAKELRVKETDRIKTISSELGKLGVKMEEFEDGFSIIGKQVIKGGRVSSLGDHRIGMAMAIAGLVARDNVIIELSSAISVSYPNFFQNLEEIVKY